MMKKSMFYDYKNYKARENTINLIYPYIILMKKQHLTGMLVKLSKHRNESELNDLYCLLENLYNVGNK